MTTHRLSREELIDHLRTQVGFLERSAQSYDQGYEDEAKRLAIVMRVLLHDTSRSQSLLTQLHRRNSLRYIDSADPINPRNLLPTPGLVLMEVTAGEASATGAYVPPLGELGPNRQHPQKQFGAWWMDPVTKARDGTLYGRRDYVLTLANKGGGGHVDPELDTKWVEMTRGDRFGWVAVSETSSGRTETPLDGNIALASVRQIAWELNETLRSQLSDLLDP
jgi:hypothetical protein